MGISNRSNDTLPLQRQIFGLLVTHHDIGRELVNAAESIVGPQENLAVLSNQGASFDSLCQQIRSVIPDDQKSVIMVDYFGGSAHLAVRAICKSVDRQVILCGVNLPMVLSFVTKRDEMSLSELVDVMKEDALRGIC